MKLWRYPYFVLVILLALLPLTVQAAANLLTNNGFNDPFTDIPGRTWNGQPEKIANGWQPFYMTSGTYQSDSGAKKLHWLSSAQFAAAFGGGDYHIEGNRAQNMWSSYEMNAGVYQQISGLTPGQAYGFDVAMVTYWRGPGYPDSDGKMIKQVGLDPTGGADPTSPNIVWSDPDSNDKAWVYLDVAATAQANTITVFAKVQAPDNQSPNHTDLNMVYFEAAHVAPAPTTTLNVSPGGTTVNLNWTSSGPAAGWSLKGYEVQYKDVAGGNWITLQSKTGTGSNSSFVGQAGHTYTARARTWQKTTEPYNADIDMPGPWQEKTVTVGALVAGRVTTNQGAGVSGVTVAEISGTPSTGSDSQGNYQLGLASAGLYTFTVSSVGGWSAPPPAAVSVQLNNTSYLSFTLRPPDNLITNGDFENNFAGWQVNGPAPNIMSAGRRSGLASLRLTGSVTLSQTGSISGSYQPVLSFWYKIEGGDGDDPFTAELLAGSPPAPANSITFSNAGEWQLAYLPLNLTEVYTGPVEVRFNLTQFGPTQATVYLDEVAFGAAWGGPLKAYLPSIVK
jgi:hypothetical protein